MGSSSTTLSLNELNFTIIDQSPLRIQLRASRTGSNLSNITTSSWFVVDNRGPELSLPTYAWYGNSTSIPTVVNETGVGFSSLIWSFDNGTNQTSTNLGDLSMPDGLSQSVWLVATAVDRLGNRGNPNLCS